jgi:hypothetical protein
MKELPCPVADTKQTENGFSELPSRSGDIIKKK